MLRKFNYYGFEDFEDAWDFAESDINAKVEDRLPQYGMRILSHFCGGFRFIAADRVINEPEDLNGLVVATVKSPLIMDMLSTLGADPQVSVVGELNDALEKGIYTGSEMTIPTYWRDGDYLYLPYAAVTNHAYNLWSLIIDEDTWQGLSGEQQSMVKEAAEKYAALEREENRKQIEEIIAGLQDAGVTVTWPDHELFREATKSVREKYSADFSDIYQQAVEYLENRNSSK